jgi:hypothetical protein
MMIFDRRSFHSDFLHDSFDHHGLVSHIKDLIFQGRTSGIEDENFHEKAGKHKNISPY